MSLSILRPLGPAVDMFALGGVLDDAVAEAEAEADAAAGTGAVPAADAGAGAGAGEGIGVRACTVVAVEEDCGLCVPACLAADCSSLLPTELKRLRDETGEVVEFWPG